MLDLMQQELDFSREEALTLASLTVDLIRRPAFTYRSSSVPGKPCYRKSAVSKARRAQIPEQRIYEEYKLLAYAMKVQRIE
jgi:hypothetical protein